MADRMLVVDGPGVRLLDLPAEDPLPDGHFDVRTWYSGVSAGTELSFLRPSRPDRTKTEPKLGYMEVGEVVASRAPGVPTGATVAMTYGHRSSYRADPLADRYVLLPETLDPLLGIYVAHMGPICANGLLHAAAQQHGDSLSGGVRDQRVVITGSGVVALLTGLFALRHGASEVIVVDSSAERLTMAEKLGLAALDSALAPKAHADVVFQCRGRSTSLALALKVLRPHGTVIDLAFYQDTAADVRLGNEFHHNGLIIRSAQIGRLPPGTGWDRDRLSAATISLLRKEGAAIAGHMITDVIPFEQAPQLFDDMRHRRRHIGQAVLRMNEPATVTHGP
jgi:threonine dehydrogenase-like Zn-dependent dehydrogenase